MLATRASVVGRDGLADMTDRTVVRDHHYVVDAKKVLVRPGSLLNRKAALPPNSTLVGMAEVTHSPSS